MTEDHLPEGRLIKVEFELRLPRSATLDEIDEWVRFNIGGGSMRNDNPLSRFEMTYWDWPPVLTDTELMGRIEKGPETKDERGRVLRWVRHVREPMT